MIIMCDVDNIINNLTEKVITIYNAINDKHIQLSDITTYNFFECIPDDTKAICDLFTEKELWNVLTPIHGSQGAIKQLVDGGMEVYFATATDPVNFKWKCDWVYKHFPFVPTDNIIRIKNKSLLKCDFIIDDCLDNLINIDAIRICLDYPWNRDDKIEKEYSIHRTFSWDEILNIIESEGKTMDASITLYTLSECGRCPIIRMMLDTHNVVYSEIMDNKDLMKTKHIENAPALEIGDTIIDDYHDVLRWLIKNNYYGF